MTLTRRRLMSALAAAGVAGGASRPAFAFSELPRNDIANLQALHDSACGATSSHQRLVEEVNSTLGDKVSAEDKKAVIAALTCPVCGCPLAGLF